MGTNLDSSPTRWALTVPLILAWSDAHYRRTGKWPKTTTGLVRDGFLGLNWRKVDNALRYGFFGLDGGTSLARLLATERAVRNVQDLPQLTEEQIVDWAKAHRQRTGQWPTLYWGPVHGAPGERWHSIDVALRDGLRGLPGGSSLPRLIANRLNVRNRASAPRLTVKTILALADAHHDEFGAWPKLNSGPVNGVPGETWLRIDAALRKGARGLSGGSSLAQLLADRRQVRNKSRLPRLTRKQVLAWGEAHRHRTGKWPDQDSGRVVDAPEESWKGIFMALFQGLRGFRGGMTLHQFFRRYRRAGNRAS